MAYQEYCYLHDNNRLKTLLAQVNAIETALLQSPSEQNVFVIDLRIE
jgi:hypothetical protein